MIDHPLLPLPASVIHQEQLLSQLQRPPPLSDAYGDAVAEKKSSTDVPSDER